MEPVVETEVLVIGAGPTGLTTACLLAEHGVKVALVERRPGTSDEPRAISITDETLRVMQQIGILEELKPEMLLATGSRYYGRHGQLLAGVVPMGSRLGQPAKSSFDQPVLEALLLSAAEKREGVDVRMDTEATRVRDFGTHVEVDTMGRHGPGTIRAQWLVACDGGRSPIREQIGVTLRGSTQVEKWIVIDLINTGEHERFADFYCNGVRPGVVVPGVHGRCRYEFMVLPGEHPEQVLSHDSINALVGPYLSRTVEPGDVRRATVYVAHQRVAEQFRRGRVLLAGDAAHMMPPFAGQGLNAGIRDAANLSWKLSSVINGHGTDALVASYDTERRPHATEMVKLSHRIGKVVMSVDPRVTAVRDGALYATGLIPPLKRWLTSMRFLKQPHFVQGCVIEPGRQIPKEVAALVGRSVSQPNVSLAGEVVVSLDTALGTGWSALQISGNRRIHVIPVDPPSAAGGRYRQDVQDTVGAFDAVSPGFTLIIRPDRYVAAACPAGQEHRVATALNEMVPWLAAGWNAALDRTP